MIRWKFYIQLVKTILHCKGYKWYSPFVRAEMERSKDGASVISVGEDGAEAEWIKRVANDLSTKLALNRSQNMDMMVVQFADDAFKTEYNDSCDEWEGKE